jgi:hypothetical protein
MRLMHAARYYPPASLVTLLNTRLSRGESCHRGTYELRFESALVEGHDTVPKILSSLQLETSL